MTLGNIFGGAMSSTTSYYNQYPSSGDLLEREGSGYSYGFPKKSKWKYKSEKKHAAMSALTLLAFLFFLNILQNCLREQTQPIAPEVTMMMMMPTPQKHIKEGGTSENERGGKDDPWQGNVRRTRSLLQFDEKSNRHTKFIHDFRDVKHNWANGLSQMSEKELETQRMRTDNLSSYLRPFKARRRVHVGREQGRLTPVKDPATTNATPSVGYDAPTDSDWVPKVGPVYNPPERSLNHTTGNKTGPSQDRIKKGLSKVRPVFGLAESRNRRSDVTSASDAEVQVVTPSVGLDLNTYKTYPVYNYYNHRQYPHPENRTVGATTTTTTTAAPTTVAGTVATVSPPTTEHYPIAKSPYHRYPPKNRFRYASPNRYYQPRYPIETRYRYSPYRKTSNYYESSPGYHVHEEYYPVSVVRNPADDEVGFDLIKFVWTMLSGFARPLTKMVPSFAKVGSDEPQCYDLLVCEAHRVSRLMGPTAEALASTFSTLLTWYTAEENRQVLIDAVSSGKENTCQQQILDCDERSGGKSAMTVLAQVLETKLR